MKVIVGDASGMIKSVNVEKGEVAMRLGNVNKAIEIQQMAWENDESEDHFYAARKTGVVQKYRGTDGGIVATYGNYKGSFVALSGTKSHVVTGMDHGEVEFRPLVKGMAALKFDAGKHLARIRLNPFDETKFATGGKDNDLKIWDVNEGKSFFSGKNVKNDRHDLAVPIFISDVHFLNEDSTKLVTSTEFHNVRIYDTKAGRKPQVNMSFGQYPFRSMTITPDKMQVVVADCIGLVRNIDLRMHREIAKYKGFAGAVKGIQCHRELPYLATVGLDRFLRVHHLGTRKLMKKVYLKQHLTSVLFSKEGLVQTTEAVPKKKADKAEGDGEEEESEEESEGDNDEEIWESIAEVKDPKSKKDAASSSTQAGGVKRAHPDAQKGEKTKKAKKN